DIPVTQVLWANESTGIDGDLWTDVHDPRVVGTQAPALAAAEPNEAAAVTRTLSAALARRCAAVPGCAARAALVAAGRQGRIELPTHHRRSRPELRRRLPARRGGQRGPRLPPVEDVVSYPPPRDRRSRGATPCCVSSPSFSPLSSLRSRLTPPHRSADAH